VRTRIWDVEFESRDYYTGTWTGNARRESIVARTAAEAIRKAKHLARYDERPSAVALEAEAVGA